MIRLDPCVRQDNAWLAACEAQARAGGYLRGDDAAGHAATLADPAATYWRIMVDGEPGGGLFVAQRVWRSGRAGGLRGL